MGARRISRHLTRPAAAGVIFMALAAALPVLAGTFTYTGSVQYSQGQYFFDLTTRGVYVFNGFSFSSERFTLSATVPLIYQSTPYLSYSGIGVLPSGGSESSAVNQRRGKETVVLPEVVDARHYGVGDPTLRLGLRLVKEGPSIPSVEFTAQAKVPVSSLESGFGTGAWDYGVGLALSKRLGRVILFADVSYWALGDLPELGLENPWVYSISAGFPLAGGRSALLVSYFGMTEVIAEVAPPSSLGLGLSFKVGPSSSLMLNGSLGISEASPDFAASIGWSVAF
jgi:hypothetical protein